MIDMNYNMYPHDANDWQYYIVVLFEPHIQYSYQILSLFVQKMSVVD